MSLLKLEQAYKTPNASKPLAESDINTHSWAFFIFPNLEKMRTSLQFIANCHKGTAFSLSLPITAQQRAQYILRDILCVCSQPVDMILRRTTWPCISSAGVLHRQQSFQKMKFSIPNNTIVCVTVFTNI